MSSSVTWPAESGGWISVCCPPPKWPASTRRCTCWPRASHPPRHARDAVLVFFQEVRRIAVERQRHLLVQRLLRRVVVEDERVSSRRPWPCAAPPASADRSSVGRSLSAPPGSPPTCSRSWFRPRCGRRPDGRTQLRSCRRPRTPAQLGAHILEDARSEAAGEDLVHHIQREVVGIAALGAQPTICTDDWSTSSLSTK